jgi:ABC-type sulfate/molybdate transport systems ATPase subunit
MVTHNPELTRFASRVVFMHDGDIVGDEKSAIGQVPRSLRKRMYFLPKLSEEDQLAGVSAMMKAFTEKTPKRAKTKAKAKTRKSPRKERSS